mmetsp:Transcript_15106/g.26529  ORF Transcript_15106/g.26529 Transcript_15106/m.26529 type:complete len:260 (+) Transcript_15106:113-892(+)
MNFGQLGKREKKLVTQFQRVTCAANRDEAMDMLDEAGWDVQEAANMYFSGYFAGASRTPPVPTVDVDKINNWFAEYADPDNTDTMQVDGIIKFCSDLGVSPEDAVLLVISKHFGAENMLVYTQEEFVNGMKSIGVENVDDLKEAIPRLRDELKNDASFKAVYNFTFGWACPPGQKSMQTETAIGLWGVILQDRFELLEEWCNFIEKFRKHAISKDEWQLLLDFCKSVDKNLNGYNENEAWPVLIDEFVEHVEQLQNKSC